MISAGIFLGLLVGLIMGLTGAGGGILAIPALLYGLGLPLNEAKPIALLAVGSAALMGTLHGLRAGLVRYRAAIVLAAFGFLTVPIGMHLSHHLSPAALNGLLAAVLLLVGARTLYSQREIAVETTPTHAPLCSLSETTGRFIWSMKTTVIMGAIGAVAGFLTGLLGVGGGFFIVPALMAISVLPLEMVVATSLMVIAINSISAIGFELHNGISISPVAIGFIALCILGMFAGRKLAARLPARPIKLGFSALCFVIAATLLIA